MAEIQRISLDLQLRRNGKSENWYYDGTTAQAFAAGQALADKRKLIMVASSAINEVVVRGITNKRTGDVTKTLPYATGVLSTSLLNDVKNVAVQVRAVSAAGFVANPWLHCLPDDWAEGNALGGVHLQAGGSAAVDAYCANVIALNMMLRGISRNPLLTKPTLCKNLGTAAGVTTVEAPGFTFDPAFPVVIITRPKGYKAKQWRGEWRVIEQTGDVLTITAPKNLDPTAIYLKGSATIRRLVYDYSRVATCEWIHVGTRKMGRIPRVAAGRHSAR